MPDGFWAGLRHGSWIISAPCCRSVVDGARRFVLLAGTSHADSMGFIRQSNGVRRFCQPASPMW